MWLIKQILCLAIQSVVLRPVAIASPGNLLEMLNLMFQPRPTDSVFLDVWFRNLDCFLLFFLKCPVDSCAY